MIDELSVTEIFVYLLALHDEREANDPDKLKQLTGYDAQADVWQQAEAYNKLTPEQKLELAYRVS